MKGSEGINPAHIPMISTAIRRKSKGMDKKETPPFVIRALSLFRFIRLCLLAVAITAGTIGHQWSPRESETMGKKTHSE